MLNSPVDVNILVDAVQFELESREQVHGHGAQTVVHDPSAEVRPTFGALVSQLQFG